MAKPNAEPQDSRIRPGVIVVVVAILGVLIAGKFLGWYGGAEKPATYSDAGAAAVSDPVAATPPPVTTPGRPANPGAVPGASPANPSATAPGALLAAAPNQPGDSAAGASPGVGTMQPGEWEQRLDDILGAADDEPQKATKLLEMFPQLPEDGQIEVAQHLSNLLPDDRYGSLAQSLTNTATPEGVLEVLMTDVLNRGNGIKLPTLLQVARTPNHPKAEEARDVLEVFVDENYGADWTKWEKAVQDWLKENPDEPAEEPEK